VNKKKKSKSFLGMSTGPRRNSLKKKTRGKKSRGTVPLRTMEGPSEKITGRV
jgi:hypothetical protein